MALNDVLLVVFNNQGHNEENFISTVDEFINTYCFDEDVSFINALKKVIERAAPCKWASTYYISENCSYDFRICQGPDDLIDFLNGKYNDSIENMENRFPGTAGLYSHWSWDNDSERFSERAIQAVSEFIEKGSDNEFSYKLLNAMPSFPFFKEVELSPSVNLESLINDAEKHRVASNNKFNRSYSELEV